jgi:hypothetical protein
MYLLAEADARSSANFFISVTQEKELAGHTQKLCVSGRQQAALAAPV